MRHCLSVLEFWTCQLLVLWPRSWGLIPESVASPMVEVKRKVSCQLQRIYTVLRQLGKPNNKEQTAYANILDKEMGKK